MNDGNRPWRILIVDDHPVVRSGYTALINAEAGMEVVGQAASRPEALRVLETVTPDLALVDITLEQGSGLELIKDMATRSPSTKVLVISMHDESLFAERCVRAGAQGFISKRNSGEAVLQAILTVMSGGRAVREDVDRALEAAGAWAEETAAISRLSDREIEVFHLIGNGLTVREIAANLKLSPKTVENHRSNIKAKLGSKNVNELIRTAVTWNLAVSQTNSALAQQL